MTISTENTSYLFVPIVEWFIKTQNFSEFFRQAILVQLDIRSSVRRIVFYAAEETAEATPLLGCSMIVPSHQIGKICQEIYDNYNVQKPFYCIFHTSQGVHVAHFDPASINKLTYIHVPVSIHEPI